VPAWPVPHALGALVERLRAEGPHYLEVLYPERRSLHATLVGARHVLVVSFDDGTSLGLVRLRVKKATGALEAALRVAGDQR
jgi:predicted regulator of Ras-like GTPase activity (Roadblock/LC7/MglB family)